MRPLLRLFPAAWRERYGAEFAADFDAGRTALGLRWRELRASREAPALLIAGSLTLALTSDLFLTIGMDERLARAIASHWWGAPSTVALTGSVAGVLLATILVAVDRGRLRALVPVLVVVALAALAGSAGFAAVSFSLAGPGAGVGLICGAALARWRMGTSLTWGDAAVALGCLLAAILGWLWAETPLGPAVLLVVVAVLVSSRRPCTPRPSTTGDSLVP